jgi:hypothetical protein
VDDFMRFRIDNYSFGLEATLEPMVSDAARTIASALAEAVVREIIAYIE